MLSFIGVCVTILLLMSSIKVQGKPQQTKPGCRYEGRRYQEGAPVQTAEPCLQCRCVEGSLRCRLRVCPRLPQPVPPGCRTRPPADNVCCSELVCGADEDESENILQRSNAALSHHPRVEEGCLYEGVRYGPGSAMMGSRRCEYCYCISGARRCIRPKCLLPLPGCAPLYAPHSCCPVAYNCTRQAELSTTHAATSGNGCRTGERVYQEGEMVRDVAAATTASTTTTLASCDNCFCAMGEIRCVPLACAPPLQGCKPIVREGQCCPSTYNCSGTIEVKATQNYASYAFISKDYAKFRKETNFYPAIHDAALVEGRGHRVVNEALEYAGSGSPAAAEIITERLAMATESAPPSLETETMNNEILGETTDYPKHTTRDQEQLTATTTEFSTSTDAASFDQTAITVRDSIAGSVDEATAAAAVSASAAPAGVDDATSLPGEAAGGVTTLEDTWTASTTTSDGTSAATDEDTATAVVTTVGADTITAITEALPESSSSSTSTSTSTSKPIGSSGSGSIIAAPAVVSSSISVRERVNCVSHGPEPELESTSADKVRLETTTSSINLDATPTTTPTTTTTITTTTSSSTSTQKPPPPPPPPSPPQPTNSTTTTRAPSQSSPSAVEKAGHGQTSVADADKAVPTQAPAQKKVDVGMEDEEEGQKMQGPIAVKRPSVGGLSTSIIVPDDMLVMNVTVKTNVAVGHIHGVTINPIGRPIPPDIEALLNITNRGKGEDYEYDYSEPTLPPSLPNVRIIPFVAADALVKDKDVVVDGAAVAAAAAVTGYPASRAGVALQPPEGLGPTDAANFYDIVTQENRFSPPEKTEGGFVPRDPPYFDPLFHSSNLNLEIGTGVTVSPELHPVPNSHRKNNNLPNNCLYEEHEYGHGHILPRRALCIVCICYYGEIVCSNQKCPPLKIGCKRVNDQKDKCCSKVVCVDGVESPTVVLDRADSTSSFQHEPTVSPDPFRDVIKTEPAPDLPSLIGDMMIPYLVEQQHGITTPGKPNREYVVPSRNDSNATHHLRRPSSSSSEQQKQQQQHQHDPNVVRERNASSSSLADEISLTHPPDVDPTLIKDEEEQKEGNANAEEDDDSSSIFSLDSVLDLLFNDPSTTTVAPKIMETTVRKVSPTTESSSSSASLPSSTSTSRTTATTGTAIRTTRIASRTTPRRDSSRNSTTTTTTMIMKTVERERETAGASGGLLKLAGCNIYGRMYGVGRIIIELSSPCLECRCTDFGVQCKNLGC